MAVSKRITLPSGITTNYHRIVSVVVITNVQNVVEVASYTSKAKRGEEQSALESGEPINVFVETLHLCAPYDQQMTVERAYVRLKELPDFKGAIDVLETSLS